MKARLLIYTVALSAATHALANPAHERLSSMTEPERNRFFARYLQSSGETCPSATRNFYMGSDTTGTATWSVRCSNGREVAISIQANATGSSRVIDCSVLKAVAGVPCFQKFRR